MSANFPRTSFKSFEIVFSVIWGVKCVAVDPERRV